MRFRRQQILQQLLDHGAVQVNDLTEQFGVSAVTIRADLNHLRAQGLVTRTHGGALLLRPPPTEQDIHEKDSLNLALKERIGKCAAGPDSDRHHRQRHPPGHPCQAVPDGN